LSVEQDLYTLVGRYEEFSKQTFDRLDKIDSRINEIDGKLEDNKTCSFHFQVIEALKEQAKIDGEHGKKLSDLDKGQAVQELKLSNVDRVKTDAGALAAIYSILKIVAPLFGIHIP